jgi:DNA mismatch repair protein MutL
MSAGRIQILPPSAAERIAAGEVVERPASAVKELIENSLDAGAQRITIEVEGAGCRLIRISDDGEGVPVSDLPLAFHRFATSKIRSADDLRQIQTYGFRGEALPSIAAVARVEMITRVRGTEAARIVVAGGRQEFLGPTSGPEGTTVAVEDLYFNTPARRQFLKSPARELAVIVEIVEALALAAPAVAFRLVDTGREVLWYPPERFADRARRVLGPEVAAHTLDLDVSGRVADLEGVLGTPQVAQRRRTHQWFLVNGRPVRSPLLARALAQGYHTLIPQDRHPAVVLAVRLPAGDVDANVHPRKAEVRFVRERLLFDSVVNEVRGALRRVPLSYVVSMDARGGVREANTRPSEDGPLSLPETDGSAHLLARAQASYAGALLPSSQRWPSIRVIGQLALTYIIGETGGDLVLIDQHAAHERVLFEQLTTRRASEGARAQGLVTPVILDLGPAEAALLPELAPALHGLGFEVEPFGRDTVRLTAVPAIAAARAPAELFRACLRDLGEGDGLHANRSLQERLAIATACHTAVRAGDPLNATTMTDLLSALERAEDPFSCFHGRPTMIRIRRDELEKWFYRRV